MEGPPQKPLNRDLPRGSVDIMGEDKFNRLQELGASLAAGKDLSAEDREEYHDLHNKFIVAVENPANTANVITERGNNSHDSVGVKNENQDSTEHPAVTAIGREKFERLQALEVMKKLLGGHLLGDDEKEYGALNSEFHTAFLEYQRNKANTAPPSIIFESPVEIFTEDDVLRWKDGAQKFETFSSGIRSASIQEKFQAVFNPIDLNALKALFLKEKPALLLQISIDANDSKERIIIELLRSFGIEVTGKYLYDKEQVRSVIEMNPDVFKSFPSTNPDDVMHLIAEGNIEANHIAVGVLLGFPIDSVKKFNQYTPEERVAMKSPEKKFVSIYGIDWLDFNDSLESKTKQAKLKAAFELSGVLSL